MTTVKSNESVLKRILKEAWEHSQAGQRFLAVFDLDSTLFDLSLRIAGILDDFAKNPAHRAQFPTECEILKKVQYKGTDWGLEKPLARAGLPNPDAHFFKVLHDHWAAGFFSNDHLFRDEPLPGAVRYVQELHQAGAHIMYLTGRDIPRMLPGTEKSLRQHGFPVDGPNVKVVLKPHESQDDAFFKLEVLQNSEADYDRIWLFENEPVNLNLVAKNSPDIGLVFIDSTHSGREELAGVLETIVHFEVDLADFRK